MEREEIVNSKEYKVSKAAIEWYQTHKDADCIDGFAEGYEQAQQDYIEYAQLWVDSGEVNIKSFKQFLKDRGYE